MLDRHGHGRFSVVGRPSGHHLIHDDAQGIQVGAVVRIAALGLLGRNVVDGAQSLLGQGVALAHDPGNAEVHHLDGAVFQHHHIVGLDVPVDNAPAVGMLQTLGDLHGKMQSLLPVQNALALHILPQGNAVDQLHHNEVGAVGGGNVVDLHNVGMAQHGNCLALRMEAPDKFLIPGKFIF